MPREEIGLSLTDLNNFTAHNAHQAERDANMKIQAASGCDYGDEQEEKTESPAEERAEQAALGEEDGY